MEGIDANGGAMVIALRPRLDYFIRTFINEYTGAIRIYFVGSLASLPTEKKESRRF